MDVWALGWPTARLSHTQNLSSGLEQVLVPLAMVSFSSNILGAPLQAAFLQPGELLSPQSLTFGLVKKLKRLGSNCPKSNTAGEEFVPAVFGKAPRGVRGCRAI